MRTMLSAVVLFLFVLSLQAQITVKSMTGHQGSSVPSMRPYLQLQNEGSETIDLGNYVIDYFFYDEGVTATGLESLIYAVTPTVSSYGIEMIALDEVYEKDGKKANLKIRFSFDQGTYIDAGAALKLHQGINKIGWNYNFQESDDWSYAANSNYTYNENIVVRDVDAGVTVFGNDPTVGGAPSVVSVPLQWLGTKRFADLSAIQIKEGDAFFNVDDKNAYVFFGGRWAQLAQCGVLADGSVSFTAPVAGVTPVNDNHLATKKYVDDNTIDTSLLQVNADGTISAPNADVTDESNGKTLVTKEYLESVIRKLGGTSGTNPTDKPAKIVVNGMPAGYTDWDGEYALTQSGYYKKVGEEKYIGNGNGQAIWVMGTSPNEPYYSGICYVVDDYPGKYRNTWEAYRDNNLISFQLSIVFPSE